MNIKFIIFFLLILPFVSCKHEIENAQWRGSERMGTYDEKNLLKKWPEKGPVLLWSYYGVGNGYGSPVITSDRIFVNGEVDSTAYLFAFDIKGHLLWKSGFGKEWTANFPGCRSTPTIYGGLIYVISGFGKVVCFEPETGKEKWSVDLLKDFKGKNVRFGYSESLLVDEKNVYCSPGASDTNIIALDRITGKTGWISKALGEIPSYCTPLLVKLPTRNILVTFSLHAFLGIDTKNGKLLWFHKQDRDGDIHGNTAIYDQGFLYYNSAAGNGTVKLELSKDGSSIKEIWRTRKFSNAFGGFVKVNDYLYGSGYEPRFWKCVDVNTGNVVDSLKFDRGVTIYADSMLYCYNEKGEVGLVKIQANKMELVSSFKITKGTNEHFSHQVISNGVLYVRHGKALLAYDIKKK